MNDFKPIGPHDEQSVPDGDQGFIGVEERLPPQQLAAGYVAGARNKRFRNGRASTREGITLLPWMKVDGRTPFEVVYGGAVFNDPNQSGQWILIAADGGVWKTRPNLVAQPVTLPPGVTLTADTFKKFVQANAAIVLLRGLTEDPLVCTNLEEGFKPIVQQNVWDITFDAATNRVGFPEHNLLVGDPVRFGLSPAGGALPAALIEDKTYYVLTSTGPDSFLISAEPGGDVVTWNTSDTDDTVYPGQITVLDGAQPIPPALDGIFILNRLLLINGKDTCVVSDIGDFTRYQPVAQEFRINQGDSYTLVSLALYNQDTVVFFKDGSVSKVVGVSGDLSQAIGPLNVTDSYGAASAQAVTAYGKEIYWLTNEVRVATLTLTALNQEQGTNNALSDPLVQTFGRVNGTYGAAARLAVYNGFLHVALPLDDARLLGRYEFVPAGTECSATVPAHIHGLTVGKTYAYVQGPDGARLVNGTETLTGDADFIAQGLSVDLYSSAGGLIDCNDSIVQVLAEGCNTGVAVFDFLNEAWAGTDEAAGVTVVKDWLKFRLGGQERLGFIGADGWLHLYYEGLEDELLTEITPYVDVLADRLTLLTAGDQVRVNAGTVVTAANSATNAGLNWGIASGNAQQNLWQDSNGTGGFNPAATDAWTLPNATMSQIDSGVRFISTNGNPVQVRINGAVVADGYSDWAFIDAHPGPTEILSVPISDWVRTRAYLCRKELRNQMAEFKRYLQMAAQLATWSPNYTISAVTPGVQTLETYATGETRDRLKYFSPHDAADWDPTNVNNDFDAPRREDYSWVDTGPGIQLGAGVSFDQEQEYVHRVPVNERGVWMQLDLVNADGRLELLAVAMESESGEVLSGPSVN